MRRWTNDQQLVAAWNLGQGLHSVVATRKTHLSVAPSKTRPWWAARPRRQQRPVSRRSRSRSPNHRCSRGARRTEEAQETKAASPRAAGVCPRRRAPPRSERSGHWPAERLEAGALCRTPSSCSSRRSALKSRSATRSRAGLAAPRSREASVPHGPCAASLRRGMARVRRSSRRAGRKRCRRMPCPLPCTSSNGPGSSCSRLPPHLRGRAPR